MPDPIDHQHAGAVMRHAKPLDEFPWSAEIVGMGYLPDEVSLPRGWRWDTRPADPRSIAASAPGDG
jgi:hypothetical protein